MAPTKKLGEASSSALDNVTNSLMQMISKYEIIAGDCKRIYEKTEAIKDQLHDVKEIRAIVTNIMVQCECNQRSVASLVTNLDLVRTNMEDLITTTETDHYQHTEKLNSIVQSLSSASTNLSNIETKLDDTRTKIAPVAKLSKMISTPLGLALFIFGFITAVYAVTEIAAELTDSFHKKTVETSAISVSTSTSTNRTSNSSP